MTALERLVSVEAYTERARLHHVFLPWSLISHGTPPPGAKPLCGRMGDGRGDGSVVGSDAPTACLVCLDLLEGLRG